MPKNGKEGSQKLANSIIMSCSPHSFTNFFTNSSEFFMLFFWSKKSRKNRNSLLKIHESEYISYKLHVWEYRFLGLLKLIYYEKAEKFEGICTLFWHYWNTSKQSENFSEYMSVKEAAELRSDLIMPNVSAKICAFYVRIMSFRQNVEWRILCQISNVCFDLFFSQC